MYLTNTCHCLIVALLHRLSHTHTCLRYMVSLMVSNHVFVSVKYKLRTAQTGKHVTGTLSDGQVFLL